MRVDEGFMAAFHPIALLSKPLVVCRFTMTALTAPPGHGGHGKKALDLCLARRRRSLPYRDQSLARVIVLLL
jgi:hypothetical protein